MIIPCIFMQGAVPYHLKIKTYSLYLHPSFQRNEAHKIKVTLFMKKIFSFLFFLLSLYVVAQSPVNYYNAAVGKSDATLRTSLQSIIASGHSVTSYGGLYTAYGTTDINPSTGKIWDMYSNCNFTYYTDENHGTNGGECTNYNREHTSPQSWFAEASPMVSDLFNVYPTDSKVNSIRNNYPYGEVSSASLITGNGSQLGSSDLVSYSGIVFEPIDEFKGDLARTCLYMATRYASVCENWIKGASVVYGSNQGLSAYSVELFMKWSRQDPVSPKETSRNNAVEKVQHNRNPFIDHPELAEYIWGTRKGDVWSLTSDVDEVKISFSISPNPVRGKLTIESRETDLTYAIYNLNGQLLQEDQLNAGRTISVDQLNKGMYLLQLKSGTRKAIQKFIVSL